MFSSEDPVDMVFFVFCAFSAAIIGIGEYVHRNHPQILRPLPATPAQRRHSLAKTELPRGFRLEG